MPLHLFIIQLHDFHVIVNCKFDAIIFIGGGVSSKTEGPHLGNSVIRNEQPPLLFTLVWVWWFFSARNNGGSGWALLAV